MRWPKRSSIGRNVTVNAVLNQESGMIDSESGGCMIFPMKRQFFSWALITGLAAGALILTSCSTTETRISGHPEIFQTLPPRDRARVAGGKLRVACPKARFGWPGVRPIGKLWVICAVVQPKPGFM